MAKSAGGTGPMQSQTTKREEEELNELLGKNKFEGGNKDRVEKGMNLWDKKSVTISGERIIKVDRVAAQVAKLIAELKEAGVPVHNAVCLSEYLDWLRRLCKYADMFVSSKPVGVGVLFRVDRNDTAIVQSIEPGSPASFTDVQIGDELAKIDETDVYRMEFQSMADIYLGREGTEVSLVFKRPDQPHPVTAVLRRSGAGVSEIACDLRPGDILERVRFAEKSLLTLRFELEEWGIKNARQRIHELRWHQSVIEDETAKMNHRCLRLAKDLGFQVGIQSNHGLEYDRNHTIRDPMAQMVWRCYFNTRPCTKMREWVAGVQNELRNLGFTLLSSGRANLMAQLMGVTMEDSISAIDVQSFIDHWNPPVRWPMAPQWPWPEAGHGLLDALRLAELNLHTDGPLPDWFRPFLPFQEASHLLRTADPGTFVVRYSQQPGNFAIQWVSAGRQTKHAKVFVKQKGYAWRHNGNLVYPDLASMLRQVHSFLSKGVLLPEQKGVCVSHPLGPDDD